MTANDKGGVAEPSGNSRHLAAPGSFRETFGECIRLSPLLVLYLGAVLLLPHIGGIIDEDRYLMLAGNLAHGYYSPPGEINLWFGWGYPLVLMPFKLLGIPLVFARILNAVMLFLAVLSFNATLRLYISRRAALVCSYVLLGLHIPLMIHLKLLMTEPLMMFLVCASLLYFCRLQAGVGSRGWNLVIAAALLAYLAMTKVFFGYVIPCALLLALVLFLLRRGRKEANSVLVCALGLVLCMPWLAYTYSLTGKVFYWGTSGGSSLYWMSSPFPDELGDWHPTQDFASRPELAAHHGAYFESLKGMNQVEEDAAFKKKAMENIRAHPKKYLSNWFANIGRLLLNYPMSHTPESLRPFIYIIPGMFQAFLWVLCLYPLAVGWRRYPYEVFAALVFGAITMFGSSLLSAYPRMGWPIFPLAGLWVAFSLSRIMRIEVRGKDETAAVAP